MESLWQDIKYGARTLARSPGFTAAAVLTLALGIGANTAIFSVVHTLLYRPLPVKDAHELVSISEVRVQGLPFPVSYPDYRDYRELREVFTDAVAFTLTAAQLSDERGTPDRFYPTLVSGNYFSTLGVEAALGRTFDTREATVRGAGNVLVLNYGYWQRRFGGDPSVVGRTVRVNGAAFAIIGVAPESFPGTYVLLETDAYLPMTGLELMDPSAAQVFEERGDYGFRVIARLQPGVSLEEARAAVAVQAQRLAQEYPDSNKGVKALVYPEPMTRLEPGAAVFLPPIAGIFMALVGLVLLIACANVANLLLARASGRQKEMAVRAALGAGRGRLARQLLTESLLLALLAGGAALLLAQWGVKAIGSIHLATEIPISFDFSLNYDVLVFALVVAVLTGVVAGLVPSLQASKFELQEALKEGGRGTGSAARHRLRSALVVAQVAVSLVLLAGAGLFLRSLWHFSQMDLGFRTDNRLLFALDTDTAGYQEARSRLFYRELLARVRALPGVRSASAARYLPIDLSNGFANVYVEGQALPADEQYPTAGFNAVGPDYFRTLGIPLLAGRKFTQQDTPSRPGVVIVNERAAEIFWPGENPLGKRLSLEGPEGPWLEVVGVAKMIIYNLPGEQPPAHVYLPLAQRFFAWQVVHVATDQDPLQVLPAVREQVRALDAELPLINIKTMATHIREGKGMVLFKVASGMVGSFGVIGLVLGAIGLYGVMAYSVTQRTHEIGVRMALGASTASILGMVLRHGLALTLAGIALGLAGAFALTRLFANLLVGVTATDPATFAGVAVFLVAVALVAAYVPARRAARTDPLAALRYE